MVSYFYLQNIVKLINNMKKMSLANLLDSLRCVKYSPTVCILYHFNINSFDMELLYSIFFNILHKQVEYIIRYDS